MPDISQYARKEWGANWCAPAAVGNSFLWMSKVYDLPGLVHEDGNGDLMSGEDVVEDVGVAMGTDPNKGTTGDQIENGKKQYIQDHGLTGTITVERKRNPTKEWLKEQYAAGQDVEMAYGYRRQQQENGPWERLGTGHAELYGDLPGEIAGGHIVSIVSLFDPFNNDLDTDFQVTFTDPGRDDLAGQFGCIASEQYVVLDPLGNAISCTASTYNVRYVLDFFGPGENAYVLEGYTGLENGRPTWPRVAGERRGDERRGIIDPTLHYCCYKLKCGLKPAVNYEVTDQFWTGTISTKKRAMPDRIR
jgi:hypothetical protein